MDDIIVVGGGLTGVMMALTLSHGPFSVAHINRQAPAGHRDSVRTITINAAGKRMLDALGVWAPLADCITPINQVKVADAPGRRRFGARRQSAFPLGWQDSAEPMAYVVPNDRLLLALEAQLRTRDVRVIANQIVTGFTPADGSALIQTEDDDGSAGELACRLAVGCDGRSSTLRQSTKIRHHNLPHQQTAIVAIVTAMRSHENTAYQRFLRGGPIALMPMQDNQLSLVWTLPKADAGALLDADVETFNAACNDAFGDELGKLELVSDRLSWSLQPSFVTKPATSNLVLAGDAAHAILPLAGQGYNLALADAAVLLDILHEAYSRGLPAGHVSVCSEYVARRRAEVATMSAATVGLNTLFSKMPHGVEGLAGLGMVLLDRFPAKSLFAEMAKGGNLTKARLLDGDLPSVTPAGQ